MHSNDSLLDKIANLREQLVQEQQNSIEKDKQIIKLERDILILEKKQNFEINTQGIIFNKDNGLYEDTDGNQFCKKCRHERCELVPVSINDSRYPDQMYCCICKEHYQSAKKREERLSPSQRKKTYL